MAQGYGWGDAAIEGFKDGRKQEDVKQQREERALGIQATKSKLAEDQRVRDQEAGRRNDLISANQAPQSADGAPMAERRPFEAYAEAAQKRLAAGDMDGYESYASKADAHKAKWYTDAIGEAYRKNDMDSGLALLNEFPDGVRYSLEQGSNGELVGVAAGPDGKVKGRMPFKSEGEFWGFVAQRADPASVFQKLREQRKQELEGRKLDAEIGRDNAAAAASQSTATYNAERTAGQKVENTLLQTYGPLESKAKIGLLGAQANSANANAGESAAGAGLKRKQSETLPDKDEAKADRVAIQIAQLAARMATDYNKQYPYNPESHKSSDDFIGQATANFELGRQAVKPGVGFARPAPGAKPISGPGVPPAKDFSNLWK